MLTLGSVSPVDPVVPLTDTVPETETLCEWEPPEGVYQSDVPVSPASTILLLQSPFAKEDDCLLKSC